MACDDAEMDAIQVEYIKMSVWIKQVNFPSHLWYRVVCHLHQWF